MDGECLGEKKRGKEDGECWVGGQSHGEGVFKESLEGSECVKPRWYPGGLGGGVIGEKREGMQASRGDRKGKGLREVGLAWWRKERRK